MYVKILKSVYRDVVSQLEYKTYELLGIIGSSGHNTIDFFLLDDKAISSKYHCKPDSMMNSALQKTNGIHFVGIIHSHPPGRKTLSIPDIQYAHSIIQASKNLPFILMGIACDNELFLYQVSLERITPLTLHIVNFYEHSEMH